MTPKIHYILVLRFTIIIKYDVTVTNISVLWSLSMYEYIMYLHVLLSLQSSHTGWEQYKVSDNKPTDLGYLSVHIGNIHN